MAFGFSCTNTKEPERICLKRLTENKVVVSLYLYKLKQEWFTTEERRFVYECIKEAYEDSHSSLSDSTFRYFAESRIDSEEKRSRYLAEWELVNYTDSPGTIEEMLHILRGASVARSYIDIAERSLTEIDKGNIGEAIRIGQSEIPMLDVDENVSPVTALEDYGERVEVIHDKKKNPDKFSGIKTPFPSFNRKAGGLFAAELTMLSAVTGVGKSTIMKMIGAYVVRNYPINILHVTNEEGHMQVEYKYDSLFSGLPYGEFKRATISTDDMEALYEGHYESVKEDNGRYGRIFVKTIRSGANCLEIENAVRLLEMRGIRIGLIIIDYLDKMSCIARPWGENDEQKKTAEDVKSMLVALNIPGLTATQAGSNAEKKQEKGRRFNKSDNYGSKARVQNSDNFGFIIRQHRDNKQKDRDEEQRDWFWCIDWIKQRDGPSFYFYARHSVLDGKVWEVNSLEGEAKTADTITVLSRKIGNETPEDIMSEMENDSKGGKKPVKKAAKKGVKKKKSKKDVKNNEEMVEVTDV